jgi:hypothetical protein
MSNQLQTTDQQAVESLILNGDLSKLTPQQKVSYYKQYCDRLGLDVFTQPFKILRLQGKETLYCDRSGTQQLNKLHKVSHKITARETVSDCYVVTACAYTPDQRQTESIGAVNINGLKGEALCNAMMKAETKAKRRATLDLLGLGVLDESELDTIPNAQVVNPIQVSEDDGTHAPGIGTRQEGKQPDIDMDMWQDQLNACKDKAEFNSFYKSNRAIVDNNQELFKIFSARATELGISKKQAA